MSAKNIKEQTIFQSVITKSIDSDEQLVDELLRSTLIGLVNGFCLPLGVKEGELMLKKLHGTDLGSIWNALEINQQREMHKKIAGLLVETKQNYQTKGKRLIGRYCSVVSFEELVNDAVKFLSASSPTEMLESSRQKVLSCLNRVNAEEDEMTLVHGDLGLSNIMLVGNELVLVDFEHLVEGPLELELAVSYFWSDNNSLQVNRLSKFIRKLGEKIDDQKIISMAYVYLAYQLKLAVRASDNLKINQLINVATERKLL